MRYEEIRNYIRSSRPCPELAHADGASASHHSGFIELLDAAYATYLNTYVRYMRTWSTILRRSVPVNCV